MRTIDGRRVFGVGFIAIAISIAGIGCTTQADEHADETIRAELDDDLALTAKPGKQSGPSMACEQATGGCAPVGFRNVNCALSSFKPNTNVVVCVKGGCPSVYGMGNATGETCFPEQKVGIDGTARAFFSVRPDASYSFTTRSGAPKAGDVLATASASVQSSIGVSTQCGGEPIGCN